MTSQIHWFDGSTSQPATARGWWDGTDTQQATLLGWWDGAAVQPVAEINPPPTADPLPTAVSETFLDDQRVTDSTATISTTTLTRSTDPLFPPPGPNDGTWDKERSFISVTKRDGIYHGHYYAVDENATNNWSCYITSTDGEAFTRPNLGLVDRGGNTNNNILYGGIPTSAFYDDTLAKWVIVGEPSLRILTSDSAAGPFTEIKVLSDAAMGGIEGKEIVRRPDGRWVGYFTHGHSAQRRNIGAFLSDTTDPAGTWTTIGDLPAFTATSADHQFYGIGVERVGDVYAGFVMIFDQAVTDSIWLDLYVSRDCLNWQLVEERWADLGPSGTWDDHMLVNGSTLVEDGNLWEFFYTGSPLGHAATMRDMRIGKATVRKGGLRQATGPGAVTTTGINVQAGSTLTVNADASSGSVTVEVLDLAGNVLPGYGGALSTDSLAHALTIPARQVTLRFTLAAGAKLYGYQIA